MDWIALFIFLAASGAAATTGSMFQPGVWYDELDKPVWTPPNWLFPIAWTLLYIAISVAAARVVAIGDSGREIGFWALQIALNTLWTPIFFGKRNLRAAFVVIVALWLAVGATMLAFFRVDGLAGWLFVPYLIWVSYAGALNLSLWKRNPNEV